MATRYYFAGVNGRPLAESTRGQDVLVSYADFQGGKGCWNWIQPLLEFGHWRNAILDSGAFTELSARKRGQEFHVSLEEYGAFAVKYAHLFTWAANLDDIEGDVNRSNRNLTYLEGLGLPVVPVFHEGESLTQLYHCINRARTGRGVLAIGCQRPKGCLVPSKVVAFLQWLWPILQAEAADLEIHGFGLTRYATADCPCGGTGWPFHSVDSTTWISESVAVHNAGATPHRHVAQRAAVASYAGAPWVAPQIRLPRTGNLAIDLTVAMAAGGQAATVARRLVAAAAATMNQIKAVKFLKHSAPGHDCLPNGIDVQGLTSPSES